MDAIEKRVTGDPDHERHHPTEDVSSWCVCGNCRHMATATERTCCMMQPRNCVSMRDAFEILVLDEGVLAIADQYRADLLAGVVRLNNEGRRHAAYRQFTLWRHGSLRQGDRRVIPSCHAWRIRDRYPSVDGLVLWRRATYSVSRRTVTLASAPPRRRCCVGAHGARSLHLLLVVKTQLNDHLLQALYVLVFLWHFPRHSPPFLGPFVGDAAELVIIQKTPFNCHLVILLYVYCVYLLLNFIFLLFCLFYIILYRIVYIGIIESKPFFYFILYYFYNYDLNYLLCVFRNIILLFL